MKKKVVVFGGCGFIGGYVVNELVKRGYNVIAADLKHSEYIGPDIFRKCDIMDPDSIGNVISEDTDFVYNFAGFASLDKAVVNPAMTIKLNIIGNLNILESCKGKKIERIIFASSSYAMNNKGSFYGISKLSSEKIVEEYYKLYGLKFTIIRYGSVYSERAFDNNYIYHVVKDAVKQKKITHDGDGEEIREYIHAADAAKLSVNIIGNNEFENQHIILTGMERMRRKELFLMIKELLNDDIQIVLKGNEYANHYKLTPYSFHPTVSKKLVSNPFIDMGQGLLECIKEVHRINADNE